MLIVTRKAGEKITIGPDIKITVQWMAGNRTSLAVEAPEDVAIVRVPGESSLATEAPGFLLDAAKVALKRNAAQASFRRASASTVLSNAFGMSIEKATRLCNLLEVDPEDKMASIA